MEIGFTKEWYFINPKDDTNITMILKNKKYNLAMAIFTTVDIL